MTSDELAARVVAVGATDVSGLSQYAAQRVRGVGRRDYADADDSVQRFESYSLARVMRELMDELGDALVYFAQYVVLRTRLGVFVDAQTRAAESRFVALLHELFTFASLRAELHEAA